MLGFVLGNGGNNMKAKSKKYAWVICVLGCITMMCMGLATSVYAVYQPFVISHNGLTNAQASALITVRAAIGTVATLLVNWVIGKINLRKTIGIAVFASAVGFGVYAIATMAKSYALYCVGASLEGIAYGLGSIIPVTVLMNRWFKSHKALAMGIAGAGTGVASLAAPPLITSGILNLSLQTTFLIEAIVMLVLCLVLSLFLRNDPTDMGLAPYEDGPAKEGKKQHVEAEHITGKLGKVNTVLMILAAFIIGCVNSPGYSHISVLFTNEGFAPQVVATLMSVLGITILLGKMLFGEISDRLGMYRSNYIFFSMYVIGIGLCCLAFMQSMVLGFAAMLILGMGYSVGTVGLPLYGLDMVGDPKEAAKQVKRFQVAYMIGAMVFATVPGIMADAHDSRYISAYILMTCMMAVAMLITQGTYFTLKRRQKKAAGK